jgi:hypothetical protein
MLQLGGGRSGSGALGDKTVRVARAGHLIAQQCRLLDP